MPERARAAGLTLLLGLSAWLLLAGLLYGLDALDFSMPKLNAGVGVAAAGAAAVILGAFALLCVLALLAATGFAVWREKRAPNAWRNGCQAAALGFGLGALMMFFDGPHASVVISAGLPIAALLLGALASPREPFLAALAVPALGLLLSFVAGLIDQAADVREEHDTDLYRAVESAAEGRDAGALQAALDALPEGRNFDTLITGLPRQGEHRAELALLLKHPKTRPTDCVLHLRAALDGDVTAYRKGMGTGFPCRVEGAWLAAQNESPELVDTAAETLPEADDRLDVLDELLRSGNEDAVARWLHAAGMTNDAGRIRAGVMTRRFINYTSDSETREQYWKHADVDAMLVAVCASGVYAWDVEQLLQRGARANVKLPCGATPLAAACSAESLHAETLNALLDAGADPNLPATAPCLEGAPVSPVEVPLWHLARRRGAEKNSAPLEPMLTLVKHGADASRKSADGGSLWELAKDDPPFQRALRGEPLWED